MAIINGTNSADTLIGTDGDDVITSFGIYGWSSSNILPTPDVLIGNGGSDTYVLSVKNDNYSTTTHSYVIDERGGDASIDTIRGLGNLIQTASFGYTDYSTFVRVGDDLLINTAYRPQRFRKTGIEDTEIKILDQYSDLNPNAQVELFQAGSTTYNLIVGDTGTASEDIMAGSDSVAETFYAGSGNDFLYGNGGDDFLYGEGGDDYIRGGTGKDTIDGGAGNDKIFGEDGNDTINGGAGIDNIEGGAGKDKIHGGSGADKLFGGDGRDKLWGDDGADVLIGGAGDDKLRGGLGDDIYVFNKADLSSDIIKESGSALGSDVIALQGVGSVRDVDFSISGSDMIISYNNGQNDISVLNQFSGQNNSIESLYLGSSYYSATSSNVFHITNFEGDKFRTETDGSLVDTNTNDIIFGTDGNDTLYGGLGNDVLIGGAGADIFVMQNEGANPGTEQIRDFSLNEDLIDLSEIKDMVFSDLVITNNSYGNAHITSASDAPAAVDVELFGVDAASVTESSFVFAGANAPTPNPVPTPTPTPNPTPVSGDVIMDSAGDTVMKGTDANDIFTFSSATAFDGVNVIKDFVSGQDSIDISDVLVGYDPLTSAIEDFVMFTTDPEEGLVTMLVDADGAGSASSFQAVTSIPDISTADITPDSIILI